MMQHGLKRGDIEYGLTSGNIGVDVGCAAFGTPGFGTVTAVDPYIGYNRNPVGAEL